MSAISANLTAPPDNFSTTLSSGISSSALSIPLNSVSGLPTEGVGVLFTKDANGDVVANSVEIIHWTGIGGSSLTLTNTGDRGLTGSDAAAQAYSAGAYFEVWVTSYYYKSLRDGIVAADFATATVAAASKTTPVDADLLAIVDSAASNIIKKLTWANLKATLLTYFNTVFQPKDGWFPISDSWTFAAADAPTYTITVPSGAASLYGVGDRIKLTHSAAVKYFIVTAVADTVLTVYGGTDYTLSASALSSIYYSHDKAPLGFPLDPTKWTVQTLDTSTRTQACSANTWTNIASISLTVPIGMWDLSFDVDGYSDRTTAGTGDSCSFCISTANNTASDEELIAMCGYYGSGVANSSDLIGGHATGRKMVLLAAKTVYYLNGLIQNAGNVNTQSAATHGGTTRVRAICAYL